MEIPQASIRQYCRILAVILVVFNQDSGSRQGVDAWMYNYSRVPMRDWNSARLWCQQHFTDMVAIQNQEEISFLDQLLPFNPQYYWIGIRKVEEVWTWVGTGASLSSEAENWATGEPNNVGAGQDCVEIYIKRQTDTAKWNDENCRKQKGTVCYTASCSAQSCSVHGVCVETIGNHTCRCSPGFLGPRCEEAVACQPVKDPDQGSVLCEHAYGNFRFNSTCQFSCSRGYELVGDSVLTCQSSGHWEKPAPKCHVHQCLTLHSAPSGASMNCSHPIALNSYNSTCEFRCDEGFELKGPEHIHCSHTGLWSGNVSNCTVVRCPVLSPPPLGNMSCVHPLAPFSYTSTCSFSCGEGYSLTGGHALTCLPAGQWTNHTPACQVVRCNALKVPPRASMKCLDPVEPFSYGSACRFTCDEGFFLSGSNTTHCSSLGNWSHSLPLCQVRMCDTLTFPPHGSSSCSDPHGTFSFGSHCVFSCEEGFQLNGSAQTECSSLGMWTREVPLCQARPCPLLAAPPHHGWMNCSDVYSSFSYRSLCQFGCSEGFLIHGAPSMTCNSSGLWSEQAPLCQEAALLWRKSLLYTAAGAGAAGLLLLLLGAALLVKHLTTKTGQFNMADSAVSNPAFQPDE